MTAFLLRYRMVYGWVMALCGIVALLLGETTTGLVMFALGVAWLVAMRQWARVLDRRTP